MYHLVVLSGQEKGTRYPIGSVSVSLGRSPENDIALQDSSVSRHHATLTQRDNAFFIHDLGSTHGVFVNGVCQREEVQLQINDLLRLGNTEMRFIPDDADIPPLAAECPHHPG